MTWTADPSTPLPPRLAARPWDDKRKIPIPLMNMRPADLARHSGALPDDGNDEVEWVADFTAIYAPLVYKCGRDRLCGLCGDPLDYWIGFLGGPKSFQGRTYMDPPAHIECLEAALRLCPHIAVPNHQRAPDHRTAGATAPAGFDMQRAPEWVMGITRDYKLSTSGGMLVFRPAAFKQARRFSYVDHTLTEVI